MNIAVCHYAPRRCAVLALVSIAAACLWAALPARSTGGAEADKPAPLPDLARARWIWDAPGALQDAAVDCYLRKTFTLAARARRAVVLLTADNGYDLCINGSLVGTDAGYDAVYWRSIEKYDVTELLVPGRNVLGVRGQNMGGPGGALVAARIELEDGSVLAIVSDKTWRACTVPETGWSTADFDDASWAAAAELGPLGIAPWGPLAFPGPRSPGPGTERLAGRLVTPGPDFAWPAGVVFVRGIVNVPGPQSIWRIRGSKAYLEHDGLAPSVVGRRLHSLVPARPDGQARLLCDAGQGVLGSPRVSFDGRTVLFAMSPEGDAFFHLYRVDADGTNLSRLTSGPWHDYDPEPLPDGRIVFSSTRLGSREEYHGNLAMSLFVCDADGAGIRPLTHHIATDREPRVTADGGIAFVRSDNFLERAKVETQIHQVRADGAGGVVILGADRAAVGYDRASAAERNSNWLRNYGFGSIAPLPDGRIAAISTMGLVASRGEPTPQPLPAPFVPFDISPLPDGRLLCTFPGHGGLGVIDLATGDAAGFYASDVRDLHSVVFLGPRPAPPATASHLARPEQPGDPETGLLYCQNVFATRQTAADLARVRAVRVYEGRPLALRSARHPYDHIGVEAVELGTVPLAPDGSFYARVPADRALAMQAVDAEGRAVISEMSWIYVRPGEMRSCVGCHAPRADTPRAGTDAAAVHAAPAALLGTGRPHRFRGNNAANGGVLNLQLDRFREAASIGLHAQEPLDAAGADAPLPPGRTAEVQRLCAELAADSAEARVSAAQRLAVFRDRAATGPLAAALADVDAAVRLQSAIALAACGNREAVGALARAVGDADALVAQAAAMALEHLTGHAIPLDAFSADGRAAGQRAWQAWAAAADWNAVETGLVARLASDDPAVVQQAIESLGHVGAAPAATAIRAYATGHADADLRVLLAAIRALGHLRDNASVPVLADLIAKARTPVKSSELHELGWQQRPVQLAAAAAEALGWIATPESEQALLAAYPALGEFWYYTFHVGDHDWLRGSHSSPLHYRMAEALDALATRVPAALVPDLLRSVPIDSDRGILLESDSYETLVARVVQRSGRAPAVMETCLAVLGDAAAQPDEALRAAVTASPPAVSTGILCPESRAAHLAGVIGLDPRFGPRLRDALGRYRGQAPSRKRSWTCFMLARALGRLRDAGAVDALAETIEKDATEASLGYETPPHVFLHKAMTPFYRAAAADALGRIGDRRAVPVLLRAVGNFDNAVDVRHSAAGALARLCDASDLAVLRPLARDYPEVATRRELLRACRLAEARSPRPAP